MFNSGMTLSKEVASQLDDVWFSQLPGLNLWTGIAVAVLLAVVLTAAAYVVASTHGVYLDAFTAGIVFVCIWAVLMVGNLIIVDPLVRRFRMKDPTLKTLREQYDQKTVELTWILQQARGVAEGVPVMLPVAPQEKEEKKDVDNSDGKD